MRLFRLRPPRNVLVLFLAVSAVSVLALAWLSEVGDANWNSACDISDPNDNVIDESDLVVLTDNWLAGK